MNWTVTYQTHLSGPGKKKFTNKSKAVRFARMLASSGAFDIYVLPN